MAHKGNKYTLSWITSVPIWLEVFAVSNQEALTTTEVDNVFSRFAVPLKLGWNLMGIYKRTTTLNPESDGIGEKLLRLCMDIKSIGINICHWYGSVQKRILSIMWRLDPQMKLASSLKSTHMNWKNVRANSTGFLQWDEAMQSLKEQTPYWRGSTTFCT